MGEILFILDSIFTAIFVVEAAFDWCWFNSLLFLVVFFSKRLFFSIGLVKIYTLRKYYFLDPFNIFDLPVSLISVVGIV